jgi:hypothetical protein
MERADHLHFSTIQAVFLAVVHPPGDDLFRAGCKSVFQPVQVPVIGAVIEMHQFYQLEDKVPVAPDIREKIIDLRIVNSLEDHHVELDRRKPGFNSRSDTLKHIGESRSLPVIFLKVSGFRLSMLTLTLRSPASLSRKARSARSVPLVVSEDSMPGGTARTISSRSGRSSGSPPVNFTLRISNFAATRRISAISSTES